MTNIRHGLFAVAIAVGATFGAAGAAAWDPSEAHLAEVVGSIFGGGGAPSAGNPLGDVGGIFGGGGGAPSASAELGDVGGIFGGGGG